MTQKSVDVAIIGAGPVGLALANFLGQRGRTVTILERESQGYSLPRAITFDDEIMRVFQSMGLAKEFEQIIEIGSHAQFVDGNGKVLVQWERPHGPTSNGWPVNNRFHQPTLENTLRNGLNRFPNVEIRWQSTVVDIVDGVDDVELEVEGGPNVFASYVVGCDGGRSFTRKWIGGGSEDMGFHEPWLIVDLLNHAEETDPDRLTTHYCGTERMGSKVFAGRFRKRWEFRINPEDDLDTICDHENVWNILSQWISPDIAEIERVALYTFHSLVARKWKRGRVLIAGDAAHQTPPFMGQGMCAGIRDAANLGWKLDLVLNGGAEEFLDSYESERKPHVRQFIDLTMELGKLINATAKGISNRAVKGDLGAQNMKLIRPALGPGLALKNQSDRGTVFPQLRLSTGDWLDNLIGDNFALLVAGGISAPVKSAFEAENIKVVDDPAILPGLDGNLAVLLRPDRYILGSSADNAMELLPKNWVVQ